MKGNRRSAIGRLLLLFLSSLASVQVGAENATFTLDEIVRPPFNPVCPETVVLSDGDATLTLSGGGLTTGNPALGNPSTIYVGFSSRCGALMQMQFSPPATNPVFTLMVPSYWRDRFRVTGFSAVAGSTQQTVELRGSSQVVTVPLAGVSSVTIAPLEDLGLIGWVYSIDDISFEYEPPAPWDTFNFELGSGTAEEKRRVLIHKYRSEDSYPSVRQKEDREIEIVGTATKGAIGPVAGERVYFRVIDPPDSAPYVPAAERHDGDNKGDPGTLSATSAVTDASGRATTTLRITDRYAGDNYRIEASPDPEFSCSPDCSKSGILTAWKRVYVEQNRMFRRGTRLIEDIRPGDTEIWVADRAVFPLPPFRVKLVHASPVLGIGGEFCEEVVEVTGLVQLPGSRPGILLTAGRILNFYMSADEARDLPRHYLSDGVGLWTGTPQDHISADLSAVADAFRDAFVEYVFLPEPIAGTDGSIPRIEFGTLSTHSNIERDLFALKWGRTNSRPGGTAIAQPNHQILFIANTSDPARSVRGEVTVRDGFNDTWLFMSQLSLAQSREAAVHEFAHQWRVNYDAPWHVAESGGHCNAATKPSADRFIYNRSMDRCTMTNIDTVSTDGIIGFHYVTIAGQPDSEYVRIRERAEPIPQLEVFSPIRRFWP